MKKATSLIMIMLSLVLVLSVTSFAASKTETKAKTTAMTSAKKVKSSMAAVAKKININTADSASLTTIPGIGPKKAEAILAFRKANGKFKSVDDLMKVKGIGPKVLAKIKKNLTI